MSTHVSLADVADTGHSLPITHAAAWDNLHHTQDQYHNCPAIFTGQCEPCSPCANDPLVDERLAIRAFDRIGFPTIHPPPDEYEEALCSVIDGNPPPTCDPTNCGVSHYECQWSQFPDDNVRLYQNN